MEVTTREVDYIPLVVNWEVQGKCGRGWTNLGVYRAGSDLAAARQAYRIYRFRTVRVRAADLPDKYSRIRFKKRSCRS